MQKGNSDDGKVSVRVGKARVVSRARSSMDMVADGSTETKNSSPSDASTPSPVTKPKRPLWRWGKKKESSSNKKKAPVSEAPQVKAEWADKIIRILLHVSIIVVPLLFLPFTFEAFELNKQMALVFLSLAMFIFWLLKIIIEKRVTLVKTALAIPILVWLGVHLLSTLLSVDVYSSLFGFYGRFNGSFIQFVALAIIFFVAINNIKSIKQISKYLYTFAFAYLVVVVFSLLQSFGAYIFPWEFARIGSFNLIGASTTSLGIFLAAGLGIIVTLVLRENNWRRSLMIVISVLGIIQLFILGISIAWIGLLAVMVVIFAVVVVRLGQVKSRVANWLPLIFLAVAVALILIPTQGLVSDNIPAEISLGRPVSYDIAQDTFAEHPIIGSGPETFFNDFNLHRPVQFNDSPVWNLRFDKAATQFIQDMSTLGLLGLVALGAIVVIFVLGTFRTLVREPDRAQGLYVLGPFASWIGLLVVSFFYFFNTSIFFMSWMFMALTVAGIIYLRREQREEVERQWSFATSPQMALVSSFVFLLVLIGGIVSVYYLNQAYLADVHYRTAQEKMQSADTLEEAATEMVRAAQLNSNRSVYHRGAAQAFMSVANREAVKEDPDVNVISNNVGLAIEAVRAAVSLSPNNVVNYEFQAGIYQNAGLYVQGTAQWVIDSYNQAIELDPNNPLLYAGRGKAYVFKADRILIDATQELENVTSGSGATEKKEIPAEKRKESEEALNMAVAEFQKAIELKPNYFDAHLSLAQTYDKKGDNEQAVDAMLVAVTYAGQNPDAFYELGRIYYNAKKYDEAAEQFTAIIEAIPEHANALYSLGLVYMQQDKNDEAVEVFEKVLELNPDNEDIKAKIEEAKKPGSKPELEVAPEVPDDEPVGTNTNEGREVDTGVELEDGVIPEELKE